MKGPLARFFPPSVAASQLLLKFSVILALSMVYSATAHAAVNNTAIAYSDNTPPVKAAICTSQNADAINTILNEVTAYADNADPVDEVKCVELLADCTPQNTDAIDTILNVATAHADNADPVNNSECVELLADCPTLQTGLLNIAAASADNAVAVNEASLVVCRGGGDFGDAPAGYEAASTSYHTISGELRLGLTIDAETSAQSNDKGDGDDSNGDDEDGVTFSTTRDNNPDKFQLTAHVIPQLSENLCCFLDFDPI